MIQHGNGDDLMENCWKKKEILQGMLSGSSKTNVTLSFKKNCIF